jgi:hypothetical protein
MICCVDALVCRDAVPSVAMVLPAKPSSSRVVSRVTDVSDFCLVLFPSRRFNDCRTGISKMKGKGEKVLDW